MTWQTEIFYGSVLILHRKQDLFSKNDFICLLRYVLTGVRSCYDEGKRVAETLMFDYHRQHGIGKIDFFVSHRPHTHIHPHTYTYSLITV